MKKFSCKIEFIADYLQAKMSENSKQNISVPQRKLSATEQIECNDPNDFLYKDNKGCYVPREHVKGALVNSGKDFVIKAKSKKSYRDFVKAKVFIEPEKIYIPNKKSYDTVLRSYVKKPTGTRVPIEHPVFNKGTVITFDLVCLDDQIKYDTLYEILKNAGETYGLGARRPEWGRFKILSFKLKSEK